MATKAPPKEWFQYTIRVKETLSARLQIFAGHTFETNARSEGEARGHIRYRLATRLGEPLGAFPDECMEILETLPLRRRSQRHPTAPAPSLF